MKRRTLLLRTITSVLSATIFTATGWLMGTRTLTMEPCQCDTFKVDTYSMCTYGPAPQGCYAPNTYQGTGQTCRDMTCSNFPGVWCGRFCWNDPNVNCTRTCPPGP